jgi:hypothetical protein
MPVNEKWSREKYASMTLWPRILRFVEESTGLALPGA